MRLVIAVLATCLCACHSSSLSESSFPNVYFLPDAPLCPGSVLPMQFTIDGVVVGTEPLSDRQISKPYRTTPGSHILGARIVNAFVWPDTTVYLVTTSFTRVLPVYCS